MIEVRPDPAHPRGGYAVLEFDVSEVAEDSVSITVFDLYKELYLGQAGWQPEQQRFGPYPVQKSGARGQVVIGPEIVDKIEEFSTVRLALGKFSADVGWPDDIVQSPKAATSDSAIKVSSAQTPAEVSAPIKMKTVQDTADEEQNAEEPEAEEESLQTEETDAQNEGVSFHTEAGADYEDEDYAEEEQRSKLPVILGALIVAAVVAAAAFFFLSADEPVAEPGPVPPPVETPPPVAAAPDPCSDSELAAAASRSFSDLGTALRGCGGAVSPDVALGLLEAAVADGDADALAFFGTLYDVSQTDTVIEEEIGLTLGDDPARAAEYYARARDAGSSEAPDLLAGACRVLLLRTDTLSISAREDYCP